MGKPLDPTYAEISIDFSLFDYLRGGSAKIRAGDLKSLRIYYWSFLVTCDSDILMIRRDVRTNLYIPHDLSLFDYRCD